MNNESKALALDMADDFEGDLGNIWSGSEVAAELRRQHAEIESLRAQLAARVPDRIPLDSGKTLRRRPVYSGSERLVWVLVSKQGSEIRALNEFEAGFVDAALRTAPVAHGEPVVWAFRNEDGTFDRPSLTEHSTGMVPLYTNPQQASDPNEKLTR
jgi:hypothetical protein